MRIFYRIVTALFRSVGSFFRSRTDLAIENLALRHQLAVLKEKGPKPQLTWVDRGFWVLLRKRGQSGAARLSSSSRQRLCIGIEEDSGGTGGENLGHWVGRGLMSKFAA